MIMGNKPEIWTKEQYDAAIAKGHELEVYGFGPDWHEHDINNGCFVSGFDYRIKSATVGTGRDLSVQRPAHTKPRIKV
jgi:hypothetical protein